MKKICFCILSFIDFMIMVILFIKLRILFYAFLFFNVVFVIIFFKLYFNINVINVNKIINIIKTMNIRKKISSEEYYIKKINIETFDGSGGTTHPCIMQFKNLFNNYKYYMVHTPYDNHNVEYENPSLCVSNDTIHFIKPKNINDPLLPIIKSHNPVLSYYNDNFLLFDDNKFQVWYRYTIEDKSFKEPKLFNQIYRIVSTDGVNYDEPELMIDNDGTWYLSSSIVKIDSLYYLFYFDKDLRMHCKISKNLHEWSKTKHVNTKGYSGNIWHGEVKLIDGKLYLLFLSKDYKLYFCEANIDNPFNFRVCCKLKFNYYDKCNLYGNDVPYKSTFLMDDKYIYLYIPYKVNTINLFKLKRRIKWTMTYTKLTYENFDKYVKDKNYEKNS